MTNIVLPSSDILANTKIWFTRVRPEPNDQHFHSQLGCHFEEIHEMILELEPVKDDIDGSLLGIALDAIGNLADALKAAAKAGQTMVTVRDRAKLLDSVCDQIVTGTGVAHTLNMDVINGMQAVNLSNYSKFDTDGQPIYDENHKMVKGPNYVEADLTHYV
jgi:predicted HAD superfamily Cof-like phosphohydrolase